MVVLIDELLADNNIDCCCDRAPALLLSTIYSRGPHALPRFKMPHVAHGAHVFGGCFRFLALSNLQVRVVPASIRSGLEK